MAQSVSSYETVDVLVVGSGLAGVMAALSASEQARNLGQSCRVLLASYGKTFSGSSFTSDTWGLGLIAPVTLSDVDVEDLVGEICHIGGGVANRPLVHSFIQGIHPALRELERLGVTLIEPKRADEREFIPCFDSKHRLWRGLKSARLERAFKSGLSQAAITCCESWELVDLLKEKECDKESVSVEDLRFSHESALEESLFDSTLPSVAGALFFDHQLQRFVAVYAKSVVLATGGFANLFSRALGASDNLGTVQAIAYRHGVDLVNIEFMQIMPTMTGKGEGRVFNEKMFRFSVLDADQCDRFDLSREMVHWNGEKSRVGIESQNSAETTTDYLGQLLDERGGYGPFTSRLRSRGIDFAMAAAVDEGLAIRFQLPQGSLPEFAEQYFEWLEKEAGLTAADSVRIVPYAHAANGGIRIGVHGETSLPGLFAAGEVTGGMHGADRIGGLASANALVFGMRAGEAAANWALGCSQVDSKARLEYSEQDILGLAEETLRQRGGPIDSSALQETIPGLSQSQYGRIFQRLQETMTKHCLIIRTESGLRQALDELHTLESESQTGGLKEQSSDLERLLCLRLQNQILFAKLFVTRALERKESCGSHYRADSK